MVQELLSYSEERRINYDLYHRLLHAFGDHDFKGLAQTLILYPEQFYIHLQ